jgi:iron complex outermembrane receptor protein
MALTVGVANIFDTAPPRASTALVDANLRAVGQSPVFGSQYDLVGRRVFANARLNF